VSRRRAGFTLIELLVATVLMVVVILYLLQTFTVQHRTYTVVDHMSEAQQNLRAIAALMEREVRHAGFMVPEGAAVCLVDNTNAPDILFVSDSDALDPTGQLQPDLGARVSGGFNNDSSPDALNVDSTTVDALAFYDNDNDGTNDTDFNVDAGAIIVDLRACGFVTDVDASSVDVDFQNNMGAAAGLQDLIVVPAHVYRIDANMRLTRDGDVLAPDVEDLQVALFFDLDQDGAVDANEYPGSGGSEPNFIPGAATWTDTLLREMRINFVTRSRDEDPNTDYNRGVFQTRENRAPPGGTDRFRRRVHSATIRIRNVGGRDIQL
jgi:prepilin-type N-terminal cleavage/methylation domain-containing protein